MNRIISLFLAVLSILCLSSVGMCTEEANFAGTWVIDIRPKSQRNAECSRAYFTLFQEGNRLYGDHTFATPNCGRLNEGGPESVKGIVVGSTAVLVVTSGRNGAIVMGKATRQGNTLHWTTLEDIKQGEPEGDSPLILSEGTLLLTTAQAASFDCDKATSEVEKLICGNDELSRLDDSLNEAYRRALERTLFKKQMSESQKQWLKNDRNACKDADCIKKAYETRIKELGSSSHDIVIESPPHQSAASSEDPPKLSKPQETGSGAKASQTEPAQQHEPKTSPEAESETFKTRKERPVEQDEETEDITRSLTMKCDYSDYKTFQHESVSIEETTENRGRPAGVKRFKRGTVRPEHETFIVRPGEFCECIYPSGTRVRVKVGEGSSRPFGDCGADPEVFMSLWVNETKIVSRLQFAGHCWEIFQRDSPAVSFKISGSEESVSVEKCHTAIEGASDHETENGDTKKEPAKPLSVCVDFPDLSNYPRDLVEYPPKGTKAPKVGDIELLNGSGPVCQAVLEELERDFYTFGHDQKKTKLSSPNWSHTSVELPEASVCVESIFDFNNDGNLDKVVSCEFLRHYRQGSALLVQPGSSSSKLVVSASPMEDSNPIYPPFPPFSQEADEGDFSIKGRNEKDEVYFRGRYSTISPFTFRGTTYIAVGSNSEDTKNYVAVLKPLPDGTFQQIGLFRRVPENF